MTPEAPNGSLDLSALDARKLIEELSERLRQTAEEVVPWFLRKMPSRYLQDTDSATRLSHLAAILAARASAAPLHLTLKNADESEWTMILDRNYPGLLAELLEQLPHNRPLRSAKVHSAADGQVVVDVFRLGAVEATWKGFDPDDPAQAQKRAEALAYAAEHEDSAESVDGIDLPQFIASCDADYLHTVTPYRLVASWRQCRALFGTEDTLVLLEREYDREGSPVSWRLSVATGNASSNIAFKRIATHLGREKFTIQRAYLDRFENGPGRSVLLQGYVVQAPEEDDLGPDSVLWHRLRKDLSRIRWLDQTALSLVERHRHLGLLRAEVIVAMAHLIHSSLVRENSYAYANERILQIFEREIRLTTSIADLFFACFDPDEPLTENERDRTTRKLLLRIEREVDEPSRRRVLSQFLLAIQATLYTNLYVEGRLALAIRFDPKHMGQPQDAGPPHGAFFVHGRSFNGFHVRFRDIARGGMRVVKPVGPEQHALELERLYDEVYNLAFAQQLKNKDIPEGGAKAVLLVKPEGEIDRSVKAFADSLLDLLCPEAALRARIVNPHDLGERLYLGPDENISPELIEWIVDRARQRGYPNPHAFMSSKPGAGINHKEYGVTSEGVTVFLEEALLAIGIDPRKQPFTVKITGGPDGDVAGNEIKILDREFGESAGIVGIADGSGCAEDPGGLEHAELLRLFAAGLPIAHFDRGKLGPEGKLTTVEERDGIKLRNSMHNRVIADAFIPAGGRPETINERNWQAFLHPDTGKPSSRVIVEGANLFITPEARTALASQAGVVIVKDSSANKCGVICSSFEVVASMLLATDEFLAVKPRFVAEVLERLRTLARREAQLLFREYRHNRDIVMPELSVRLSRVILRATDAIEHAIDNMDAAQQAGLDSLIAERLPPVLLEHAGDRLRQQIPPRYWSGTVAATLATKIVYREGLHYLDKLDRDTLAALALRYLEQEQETQALVAEVAGSDLTQRERIAEILRMAGTRAGLLLRRDW